MKWSVQLSFWWPDHFFFSFESCHFINLLLMKVKTFHNEFLPTTKIDEKEHSIWILMIVRHPKILTFCIWNLIVQSQRAIFWINCILSVLLAKHLETNKLKLRKLSILQIYVFQCLPFLFIKADWKCLYSLLLKNFQVVCLRLSQGSHIGNCMFN